MLLGFDIALEKFGFFLIEIQNVNLLLKSEGVGRFRNIILVDIVI